MEKMEKEKISYEGRLLDEVIEIDTSLGKPIKLVFEGQPIETEEDKEQAILNLLDSIYEFARVDEKSLNPR